MKPEELNRVVTDSVEPVHVVLLGDSTFANQGYVGPEGKCVLSHLTDKLSAVPGARMATRCAQDGALIAAVQRQCDTVPADATHLVISVGGNNGLCQTSVFARSCATAGEGLVHLYGVLAEHEREYADMVRYVHGRFGASKRIVLCAVYQPCFSVWNMRLDQRAVNLAVALFADIVARTAAKFGLPVVDFRRLFTDESDFANPIEPSHAGGEKIADAIVSVVRHHPFAANVSIVYPLRLPESADLFATFVQPSPSSASSQEDRSMRTPDEAGQLALPN